MGESTTGKRGEKVQIKREMVSHVSLPCGNISGHQCGFSNNKTKVEFYSKIQSWGELYKQFQWKY
jgi:hypothetical protein